MRPHDETEIAILKQLKENDKPKQVANERPINSNTKKRKEYTCLVTRSTLTYRRKSTIHDPSFRSCRNRDETFAIDIYCEERFVIVMRDMQYA